VSSECDNEAPSWETMARNEVELPRGRAFIQRNVKSTRGKQELTHIGFAHLNYRDSIGSG